jgi:hypothetical protein
MTFGCWTKDPVVKNSWTLKTQVENHGVAGALKGVLSDMVDWSTNVLGDLDKRISKTRKELEVWRKKSIGDEQIRKIELLRFKLNRLEE